MQKIISAPAKYVQAADALNSIAAHISKLGDKALLIADDFVMNLVKTQVENSYKNTSAEVIFEKFNGECSKIEIDRLIAIIKLKGVNCIAGAGGGKTLDTAKAIAFYTHLPVVIIPTIASSDAPCSALAVLYTPEGVFDAYLVLPKNPDLVIMDTRIIANAPVRLLVAGMGDALATYFEARACHAAGKTAMAGGTATKAALALAKLCYATLLESGYNAKLAVENKVTTKALEDIIEANTYLSGIGFESGGLAAAHAIHNGLTAIHALHHLYHGEKVAFGTIVQLVLENAPSSKLNRVFAFCKQVGLPVCLRDMGLEKPDNTQLYEVAKLACADGETIFNMPFAVTVDDVYAAILTANSLGEKFKMA